MKQYLFQFSRKPDGLILTRLSPNPDCVHKSSLEPVYRELMSLLRLSEDERPHNIAVAGDYATGKSSLLQCVAEEYKPNNMSCSKQWFRCFRSKRSCIFISLLTNTQSTGGEQPEHDETVLEQVLEKEMFKQILYSAKPSHLRPLRRGRSMPYSLIDEILKGLACLIFAFLLILLIVDGIYGMHWTLDTILSAFSKDKAASYSAWAASANDAVHTLVHTLLTNQSAFGLMLLLLNAIFLFLVGKYVLRIDAFSTKIADITITMKQQVPQEESFFDLYLDQIVYLLERAKTEIVILEDIDRTRSMKFFESLRELNDILNKDLARKNRCITFIYALSDSLFDHAENEHDKRDTTTQSRGRNYKKNSAEAVAASTVTSAKTDHEIMNVIQSKAKFFDVILYINSVNDATTVPERLKELMNPQEAAGCIKETE